MQLYKKGLNQPQILERLDQIDSPDIAQGEYNMDTDTVALISDYITQSEDPMKAQKELIKKYRKHKKIVDALMMMYPDQTPSIEDLMVEILTSDEIHKAKKKLIISDCHGNLKALKQADEIAKQYNVDQKISLGDNIDYGLFPHENECLDFLISNGWKTIEGNHEDIVLSIHSEYPSDIISPKNIRAIQDMPHLDYLDHEFLISHSGLSSDDLKVKSKKDAENEFRFIRQNYPDIVGQFLGHSHSPALFLFNGEVESKEPMGKYVLEHNFIAISGSCNIRNVSNPRVIIFDPDKKELEFVVL